MGRIRQIFPTMMQVKEKLTPAVRKLTDLLIWTNCRTTLGLVLVLLLLSALFSTMGVLFLIAKIDDHADLATLSAGLHHHKVSGAESLEESAKVFVMVTRHIGNVAIMSAAV